MILPPSFTLTKNVPTIEAMIDTPPSTSGYSTALPPSVRRRSCHQAAEQHRRDDRDRVGLEQVGGHAGAVADVVADVVGDHRRVARVVLGNAGFDLADEVRADVGALGEDAAAESREDRDQRAAEREADQRVQRLLRRSGPSGGQRVVAGDAEQAEADDEHAGDRAAAERDVQRRTDALARRSAVRTLARTETFMPM